MAKRLLEENPKAIKLSGQFTRIDHVRRIFANNLQKTALDIIINSNQLNEDTIEKAIKIKVEIKNKR